jgi:flagellin
MGLRIRTNVPSQMAIRQLSDNHAKLESSLEKLSSGLRITKASDDAAGLAISERMLAKMKSMDQAKRNANDGISYLQVAEGSLSVMSNITLRMRELTTQAASDTLGSTEREYLNREFSELSQELVRISNETEYSGQYMLTPEGQKPLSLQIGYNFHDQASHSSHETDDTIKINLDDIEALNSSLKDLKDVKITGQTGRSLDSGSPEDIFNTIDHAIHNITSARTSIGAIQSRLDSVIGTIDVGRENLAAAQSRIRDVDYASESAKYAQAKILTAAGTAVLSQTNQLSSDVLVLLR